MSLMGERRPPQADSPPFVHDRAFFLLKDEVRGKVLDVPAGEGAFAERLEREKFEVFCGDIQMNGHLAARKNMVLLDLDAVFPFKTASFDYVVCLEGIEHLENPHRLVREMNRVLKLGGKCVLSTPNVLSIRSRLSYLFYGYPNYFHLMVDIDPGTGAERKIDHINPITFLKLRYIAAQCGFKVEQVAANRLQGKSSPFFYLLKKIFSTRGKRSAQDPARSAIREALFSDAILYGEDLILKLIKERGLEPSSGKD
jgi:SAM-dependent methyltransferase